MAWICKTSIGWQTPAKVAIAFALVIGLFASSLVSEAQAQSITPAVTGVAVASDPGSDGGYAVGDSIEVQLTFSAAVTITGTPQITLDVGGGEPLGRLFLRQRKYRADFHLHSRCG